MHESHEEGYRFLERLVADFRSGANCFSSSGEALFGVFHGSGLIGVGGVNQCPYSSMSNARIRRMYIAKKYRRVGVGALLLETIEGYASGHFQRAVLFTDSRAAAKFYELCGYCPTSSYKISHAKSLKAAVK
ncbi:GNAT family N-acetyltransferase [Gilvimarinus sp. DA14]|uniref:GNAT family N-acetyltransferase n=1 Tax=Gilvimarinus sp. DA14 TaxID=2956798 RepID=UPI0035309B21